MTTAPPVRRRIVGDALRRYRQNLGYTLEDVARVLDCDRSKLSRIETGQRGIRGKELRELLTEYGIDEQRQETLIALADVRGERGWYGAYAEVLPDAYQDYLFLETVASRVLIYEAQRIPALLQTPAYARALTEADPRLSDADAWDQAVDATLARQKAVFEEHKPEVHIIVGEAALHQEVGGPKVMESQLDQLTRISGVSGWVTVQILPFTSGAHAAAGVGSLSILQFPGAPGPEVVHVDGAGGGVCLESQRDLANYVRLFEQLRVFAFSPAQSALMLWGQKAS